MILADFVGMCEDEDVRQVWSAANAGGLRIFADVSGTVCVGRAHSQLSVGGSRHQLCPQMSRPHSNGTQCHRAHLRTRLNSNSPSLYSIVALSVINCLFLNFMFMEGMCKFMYI